MFIPSNRVQTQGFEPLGAPGLGFEHTGKGIRTTGPFPFQGTLESKCEDSTCCRISREKPTATWASDSRNEFTVDAITRLDNVRDATAIVTVLEGSTASVSVENIDESTLIVQRVAIGALGRVVLMCCTYLDGLC